MPTVSWDQLWSSMDKDRARKYLTAERDRLEGEVKELVRIGKSKEFRGQAAGLAETARDVVGAGKTDRATYLERQAGRMYDTAKERAYGFSEMMGGRGLSAMMYGSMAPGATTYEEAANAVAEQYHRQRQQMEADTERNYPMPLDVQMAQQRGQRTGARMAEELPTSAVDLAATIGLGAVNPALGLAYYGGTAGADAFNEAMERQLAAGVPQDVAYRRALGVGGGAAMSAAVMERVPLGVMTKGLEGLPKALRGASIAGAKSMPRAVQATIGKAGQRGLERAAGGAAAMLTESLEEGGETIANRIARSFFEQDPAAFEGMGEELGTSMLYGGIMGGVARGGFEVGGAVADKASRKRATAYRQFVNEVSGKLSDPAGLAQLHELASKETPTRRDFREAGLQVQAGAGLRARMTENLRANLPPLPEMVPPVATEPAESQHVEQPPAPAPPLALPAPGVATPPQPAAEVAPPTAQPAAAQPGPKVELPTPNEAMILRMIGEPPEVASKIYAAAGIAPEEVQAVLSRVQVEDVNPIQIVDIPEVTEAPPAEPKKARIGKKKATVAAPAPAPAQEQTEQQVQLQATPTPEPQPPAPAREQAPAASVSYEDEVTQKYLAAPKNVDGNRSFLTKEVQAIAKRVKPDEWTPQRNVVRKSTKAFSERKRSDTDRLRELQDLGLIQRAWNNQGETYYSRPGTPVPEWLTAQWDDATSPKLPDMPVQAKARKPAEKRVSEPVARVGHVAAIPTPAAEKSPVQKALPEAVQATEPPAAVHIAPEDANLRKERLAKYEEQKQEKAARGEGEGKTVYAEGAGLKPQTETREAPPAPKVAPSATSKTFYDTPSGTSIELDSVGAEEMEDVLPEKRPAHWVRRFSPIAKGGARALARAKAFANKAKEPLLIDVTAHAKSQRGQDAMRQALANVGFSVANPNNPNVLVYYPSSLAEGKKTGTARKPGTTPLYEERPEITEPTNIDRQIANLSGQIIHPGRSKEQKAASAAAAAELAKQGVTLEQAVSATKKQWAEADRNVRLQQLQHGRMAATERTAEVTDPEKATDHQKKVAAAKKLREPNISRTRQTQLDKLKQHWSGVKKEVRKRTPKKQRKRETVANADELVALLESSGIGAEEAVEFKGEDIIIDGRSHNLKEMAKKRLRLESQYVGKEIGEDEFEKIERKAWAKGEALGLTKNPHWRTILDTLTVGAAEEAGIDLSKDPPREVWDAALKRIKTRDMAPGLVWPGTPGFSIGFGSLKDLMGFLRYGNRPSPDSAFKHSMYAWARSRGDMPQIMFDAHLEALDFVKESTARAGFLAQDAFKAAKQTFGFKGRRLPKDVEQLINDVLSANKPYSALPPQMRQPVQEMRNFMDRMSLAVADYVRQRMKIPPDATPQTHPKLNWGLYSAIVNNLGRYQNRSFQAFDDPNWKNKVTKKVKDDMKDWLRREAQRKIDEGTANYRERLRDLAYKRKLMREAKAHGKVLKWLDLKGIKAPANYRLRRSSKVRQKVATERARLHQKYWMEDQELDRTIGTILDAARERANNPPTFFRRILGSQDLKILKHRQNLPDEMLALLGEYKTLTNYSRTIAKTARLVANDNFFRRVATEGRGIFVWAPEDRKTAPRWATAKIGKKGNKQLGQLAGYMTHPDIKEAMMQLAGGPGSEGFINWLYSFEKAARKNVTVLSPRSIVRNFKSNILTLVANGHMPIWPSEIKRFAKLSAETINVLQAIAMHGDPKSWVTGTTHYHLREKALAAVKHGIIHESVLAGIIADTPGAQKSIENLKRTLEDKAGRVVSWPVAIKNAVDQLHEILYAGGDDFFKYLQWQLEIDYLKKAQPQLTDEQRMREAAQFTRNTTATYSMLPSVANKIKNMPFGLFWAYRMEQFRNIANRIYYFNKEIRGNKYQRGMALRRAFGQAAAMSWYSVLFSKLYQWINDVSDDDEEKLRRFVPDWMRDSSFIHLARSAAKNFVVQDQGYADPWGFMAETWRAYKRGKDTDDSVVNVAWTMLEPFLSESLVLAAWTDVARNAKEVSGGQVYNEFDDPLQIGSAVVNHLGKLAIPGYAKQARDVYLGYKGETIGKKHYDMLTEIKSIVTGNRASEVDVLNALQYLSYDYSSATKGTAEIVLEKLNNTGTMTEGEVQRAYTRSERNRRRAFDKFRGDIQAAIDLGVSSGKFDSAAESEAAVRKVLKGTGRGDDEINKILAGEYEPQIPKSIDLIDKMMPYATAEHQRILAEARQDKIGNLANQLTSPGETENTRDTIEQAKLEISELGLSKRELADGLAERWRESDQKREEDRVEEINERRARLGRRVVARPKTITAPSLNRKRRDRLRQLGLSASEIRARFGGRQ